MECGVGGFGGDVGFRVWRGRGVRSGGGLGMEEGGDGGEEVGVDVADVSGGAGMGAVF